MTEPTNCPACGGRLQVKTDLTLGFVCGATYDRKYKSYSTACFVAHNAAIEKRRNAPMSLPQINALATARTRLTVAVQRNDQEFYGNVVWGTYKMTWLDDMCCCGHSRREHWKTSGCCHVVCDGDTVLVCHCSHFQPLAETVPSDTPKPIGATQ